MQTGACDAQHSVQKKQRTRALTSVLVSCKETLGKLSKEMTEVVIGGEETRGNRKMESHSRNAMIMVCLTGGLIFEPFI